MTDPISILAAAREAPDAIGLIGGGQAYTFAGLARLTQQRVEALRSHPRDATGYPLVAETSIETVITIYALLETGIPAVLIHPRLTGPERAACLEAVRSAGPVPFAGAAAVLYTSGTTGTPRRAVLTRSAFLAAARASAANLGWEPADRWLLCMPLAHVGGLSILTRCLLARRCAVLAPGFDAAALPGWIEEHRITLLSLVPTMLKRVLDAHKNWTPPEHLRCVLLGGAAASPALLAEAASRRVPVVVTYGLTEACSQVTATWYEDRFTASDGHTGRPLAEVELRIVDRAIQVRGPAVMSGYWGGAPIPSDGWFETGDLGEIDAGGQLRIHARRTDLIVTGGENVYPVEIERALEAFPGVTAAGVFGVADEVWGQTVAAAVVARGPLAVEDLAKYCLDRLAPFKRPRRFCVVDGLPHTPTGKLDRKALVRFIAP